MRTIGFSGCDSDLEIDKIMRKLAKTATKTAVLERNDHPGLYELRAELAPGMGIVMIGQMTEKGTLTGICIPLCNRQRYFIFC